MKKIFKITKYLVIGVLAFWLAVLLAALISLIGILPLVLIHTFFK